MYFSFYFWLDPKVNKKSRLHAPHAKNRRLKAKIYELASLKQHRFLTLSALVFSIAARGRRGCRDRQVARLWFYGR